MWGISPLWEGDYRYSAGLVLYRLGELKGRDLWRKIVIDIDNGNYSVEKKDLSPAEVRVELDTV